MGAQRSLSLTGSNVAVTSAICEIYSRVLKNHTNYGRLRSGPDLPTVGLNFMETRKVGDFLRPAAYYRSDVEFFGLHYFTMGKTVKAFLQPEVK